MPTSPSLESALMMESLFLFLGSSMVMEVKLSEKR